MIYYYFIILERINDSLRFSLQNVNLFHRSANQMIWVNRVSYRSSHRRSSIEKVVLKNFAKFTGKHLCQSLFFDKVAGEKKKRTLAQVFYFNEVRLSLFREFSKVDYSSLPNRRDVTAIIFLIIFHPQLCYFSHHVY